jgi:hypothetical protein
VVFPLEDKAPPEAVTSFNAAFPNGPSTILPLAYIGYWSAATDACCAPTRPPTGVLDVRTLLPVALLLLAVLLWLPVDPRPAIAAAVYLGPLLPGYLVTTVQYPHMSMAWWEVGPPLVIAAVTGALLVASAARAHHLSRL